MRARRAAVLASTVLLLAACTQQVSGVASPDPAAAPPPSSPAAPPPPTEEPPGGTSGGEGTEDKAGPAQPGSSGDSGSMRVTGIRYTSDDSVTRLVVTLSGDGVPEWSVGYSEATGPDGSPVDIAGDAFLRVRVRTGGGDGGQSRSRFAISPGPVAEALTTGAADGYEELLIGVRGGEVPFAAFAETDPGQIVVEVG
ncbi:UNVERIFIED_ORG: hypothetical protein E4P37_08735 [Bacillus sp. AZ43]